MTSHKGLLLRIRVRVPPRLEVSLLDVVRHQLGAFIEGLLQTYRLAASIQRSLVVRTPNRIWIGQLAAQLVMKPQDRSTSRIKVEATSDGVSVSLQSVIKAALNVVPRLHRGVLHLNRNVGADRRKVD